MGLIDRIANSALQHEDKSLQCVHFLQELLGHQTWDRLQVRLWDGQTWGAPDARCTLVLKHPGTLRRLCTDPSELSLGEAYIYDDVDIEGDVETVFELADHLLEFDSSGLGHRVQLMRLFHELPDDADSPFPNQPARKLSGPLHSKKRDSQAVRYHYDLPPDFFALFLDRAMQYSSAYFQNRTETALDAAQERKMNYICSKLQLHPGETLLDIGCGWGGFLVFAAAHYGVRALGITLSVPQAEAARERVRNAGLSQQCRVEVCDYRDLEGAQSFDKIVSVGMFEHVGHEMLPEFFKAAWHRLNWNGLFLNSGISANALEQQRGPSFIDRYVFPDGDLVPISTALTAAEGAGFEVRDVENLREHYGLTLRQWVRRLEQRAEDARRLTDETTYRIWRLYMAGSARRFLAGRLNTYHTLLLKGSYEGSLPLTRDGWYRD
jgi:cyclopropane-fatty-acyl-phospholipid synthase